MPGQILMGKGINTQASVKINTVIQLWLVTTCYRICALCVCVYCMYCMLMIHCYCSHCSMPPVVSSTALTPGTAPSAVTVGIPSTDTAGAAVAGNKPLFPSATPQVVCVLCCDTV